MKKVDVNISGNPYRILIDQHLLMGVGGELRRFVKNGSKIAVMTSKTVKKIYSERVLRSLLTSGYKAELFVLPSGEKHKNLDTVSDMYDQLIENEYDRASCILALGGGIVGDVSGFIAATLYRGIPYVQVPTTLLSQVDSSVGGKTGVNHPEGKNLIGSFYQPKTVLIDPTVLKTLDPREVVCGYGEILKYGFIHDASLLKQCFENQQDILGLRDMELVADIIQRSLQIKAEIVAEDEKEAGLRMLLNFGHTVGHAIERASGYGHFLHGEAVILGICAALKLSETLCGLDKTVSASAIDSLLKIPLGHDLRSLNIGTAIRAIKRDKKVRNGEINMILLKDIASPLIVKNVDPGMIENSILWLKNNSAKGEI